MTASPDVRPLITQRPIYKKTIVGKLPKTNKVNFQTIRSDLCSHGGVCCYNP